MQMCVLIGNKKKVALFEKSRKSEMEGTEQILFTNIIAVKPVGCSLNKGCSRILIVGLIVGIVLINVK